MCTQAIGCFSGDARLIHTGMSVARASAAKGRRKLYLSRRPSVCKHLQLPWPHQFLIFTSWWIIFWAAGWDQKEQGILFILRQSPVEHLPSWSRQRKEGPPCDILQPWRKRKFWFNELEFECNQIFSIATAHNTILLAATRNDQTSGETGQLTCRPLEKPLSVQETPEPCKGQPQLVSFRTNPSRSEQDVL